MPRAVHLLLSACAALAVLWTVFRAHAAGQSMLALGLLVFGSVAIGLYASSRSLAWKYLFPGVAGMLVFMAVPLLYTVQLGFTNYSSAHLLSEDSARAYLLAQTEVDDARVYTFGLHADGPGWRLALTPRDDAAAAAFVSPPLPLDAPQAPAGTVALQPGAAPAGPALALREVLRLRPALLGLQLALPDGTVLSYAGVREFAVVHPLWTPAADGALQQRGSNALFKPNRDTGYFESTAGERVTPGFKVNIGWANYTRLLGDADFRGPFLSIFVWTVMFAALTVVFTTAIGMTLAVALEWQALRGRTLYRTLLFLPYAVPGFISILVFKGLFNQNFGEINAILDALFGIKPAWFADPFLAKTMLLIVNVWLGYPYIMILCSGLLKAIPADLYEASALAGASPATNFFKITAPLIIKPLAPLLVSAFAFNFNNF
ncbi:MAG: hypothetical protein RJA10_2927, partial [Pseudomonadota bacterium]